MILTKKLIDKFKKENTRDITAFGNPIILVLLAFIIFNGEALFVAIISLLTVEFMGSLVKLIAYKKRPEPQEYQNYLEKIDSSSFPSLHTARVTAIFLPVVYFSESYLAITAVLTIIITVALSRILLKKHYKTDVLGGLILGLVTVITFLNIFNK